MKFALMSLDFKRLPLEDCFRMAKEYGMDGVEIFCSRRHLHLPTFGREEAEEILAYRKKYGVEIPMLTPSTLGKDVCLCSDDPAERADGIAIYKLGIDAAQQLEVPRVLVTADHPGYFRDPDEIWSTLVESVAELASYAEPRGVRVIIEPVTPMESPVVTTAGDCARLIREVGSPALGAMLDIVPPVVVHEPISQYFQLLGERMEYVHICNTDGVTDAHLRLEEGVLPVPDVLNTLAHHGYEGFVTTELYTENYRDPELLLSNTARVLGQIRRELSI